MAALTSIVSALCGELKAPPHRGNNTTALERPIVQTKNNITLSLFWFSYSIWTCLVYAQAKSQTDHHAAIAHDKHQTVMMVPHDLNLQRALIR